MNNLKTYFYNEPHEKNRDQDNKEAFQNILDIKLEIVLGGLCSRAHVSPEPTALHFCGFNIVN